MLCRRWEDTASKCWPLDGQTLSQLLRQPHICSKADQTRASSNSKAKKTFSLKKQRLTWPCCWAGLHSSGSALHGHAHVAPSLGWLMNRHPRPSPIWELPPIHTGHSSGWKATSTKGLNIAWSQRTTCVQVSCSKTTQLPSRSGDNTFLHGIVQMQSERTHHLLGNYSSDTTAQIFMYCKLLLNSSASSSWDFRLNSFPLSRCANLRPALFL